MVHEINDLPFPKKVGQFIHETGKRTIISYLLMALLFLVITITFFLAQQRQSVTSKASYDPATKTFTDTFDGTPATPQPFTQVGQSNWDVQIHSRDRDTWKTIQDMDAMHGTDCSAPPTSHHTTGAYEESVFNCKNHIMTSINAGGYGVIYLTPNSMVDFTNGQATVTFELSTERMSARDWWDVTISPFTEAQALPLLSDLSQGTDLQGPNKNSVVITTDNGEGSPNLKVVTNGQVASYGNPFFNITDGITPGTNQMATRQTYQLTLSKTHVKFERLASATATALTITEKDIPPLSWSQGVVQFGHHSYNPEKACDYDGTCHAGTWHWDTVTINPATPFTITKTNKRMVEGNDTITFNSPAPANSYLRFSAVCRVKIDGVLAERLSYEGHPEHASSYMVPIAQGKQSFDLSFADDEWYYTGLACHAKDFAIWSTTANGTSQPTAIPTAPNTETATPTTIATIPTNTPTVAPSNSPTPTTKPTAIPSPTPTKKRFSRPTKTPTPLPTNTPTPTTQPPQTATPNPSLTGDMNEDSKVNVQDLSYMLTRWKTNDTKADLNKDKTVNTLDLSILLNNWK